MRGLAAVVVLLVAPWPAAQAETTAPRDPCAYMNHESKAYFACMDEQAVARQRAEAAPPPTAVPPAPPPKPKPKPKRRS